MYVVPSEIVADVLMRTHQAWLATPGKGGRPHKDSKIRRILPWLPSPIPGYEGSWLEAYRERWDLLAEDRRFE